MDVTGPSKEDLIRALRDTDALQFGEFELAHGGTSDYYVDAYRAATDPDALRIVSELLADRVGPDERLAGVALGGVPIVAATALAAGVPYAIVRKASKDHGTANRIEGPTDGRVVVIEDVTTTGKSALDAVETLREAGATVDRVLVVVDRESGGRERLAEAGVDLDALLTATDLLDARGDG